MKIAKRLDSALKAVKNVRKVQMVLMLKNRRCVFTSIKTYWTARRARRIGPYAWKCLCTEHSQSYMHKRPVTLSNHLLMAN